MRSEIAPDMQTAERLYPAVLAEILAYAKLIDEDGSEHDGCY